MAKKSRSRLTVACLLLCTATYAASITCDNENTYTFVGSGSAVVGDLMRQLIAAYSANRSLVVGRNVQATFETTDFRTSRVRLQNANGKEKPLLYAASESFFRYGRNQAPKEFVPIPLFAEALVVSYNLPGLTATLNLSVPIIADIYMGKVKTWNDTSIKKMNPGVKLPGEDILPIFRSDVSGHSQVFTGALSLFSDEWNDTYGEIAVPTFVGGVCCNYTDDLPLGAITYFANKVIGMPGMISSLPYSIGYQAIVSANTNNIPSANILNRAGNFIEPKESTVLEALTYWLDQLPNATDFRLLDARSPNAYPLSTFHYIMIDTLTMTNFSCCVVEEFAGFIDYTLFTAPANIVSNYFLAAITDELADRIKYRILDTKMWCDGVNVYEEYRKTLNIKVGLEDYQVAIIAVASIIIVIFTTVCSIFWWQKTLNDERTWLISSKALDLATILTRQSLSSLNSHSSSKSQSVSKQSGKDVISAVGDRARLGMPHTVYEDRHVVLLELNTPNPTAWKKETKSTFYRFCQRTSHPSLLHLFGVSTIGSKIFAVQEYCAKGTLHFVLKSSRFEFSDTIKMSMATDVADAMLYLHSKGIIHGLLNSYSCYVSSSWAIKVANWMVNSIAERENYGALAEAVAFTFDKDELRDEKLLIDLLYLHPAIKKTKRATMNCDIFSYGMLIIEILNRATPYHFEVSEKRQTYHKIIKNKFQLEAAMAPEIQSNHPSPVLERLSKSCLIEEIKNFEDVLKHLIDQRSGHSEGITDILMETMEKMIVDMEKKGSELKKMTGKMKEILNQVLPPSIAEKFILGQTVDPEYFESVSVFFSDILGFATISAISTPMEVMTFLNDLWVAFDAVIEKFDCYKADTIGDSYMVCSGLPKRNGQLHLKHIADLALELLERTSTFVIRHMPGEQMQIRIGLNSGPVTAGVVGSKMPQYCVFGDTVNTAARMESTGLPGKIQASEAMGKMLSASFPQYKLERRGEIEVKGKGLMTTFWLEASTAFRSRNRGPFDGPAMPEEGQEQLAITSFEP